MASELPIKSTYERTAKISLLCPSLCGDGTWKSIEIRKQRPTAIGFVDLPGEIRNKIYHFALVAGGPRVIRNPNKKKTKRDTSFNILRVHSAVFREAKSYFASNAIAYLPVTPHNLACLSLDQGASLDKSCQSFHYTYYEALTTMRTVHLYVHRFLGWTQSEECPLYRSMAPLHNVLKRYMDRTRRYHAGRKRSLTINFANAKLNIDKLGEFLTAIGNDLHVDLTLWWGPFKKEQPMWFAKMYEVLPSMNKRLAEHNLKVQATMLKEGPRGKYVRGDVVRVDQAVAEEPAMRSEEWELALSLTPSQYALCWSVAADGGRNVVV
jgi:hypothetical protein